MSDQFLGEIRIFSGNFAPQYWAFCNGQVMAISQNTALFSLLGTNYGGNGTSTFALPNLQGILPVHQGNGVGLTQYSVGESVGETSVTLVQQQLPVHIHQLTASVGRGATPATTPATGDALTTSVQGSAYSATVSAATMDLSELAPAGTSVPHDNRMPTLALNFCIALSGIFPPRS